MLILILDIISELFLYFTFSILGAYIREWVLLNNLLSKAKKNNHFRRKEDWPKINKGRILITSIVITIFLFGAKEWIIPITWSIRQLMAISTGLGLIGYTLISSIIKDPGVLLKLFGNLDKIGDALEQKDEEDIENK